jgi:hypothetical protein
VGSSQATTKAHPRQFLRDLRRNGCLKVVAVVPHDEHLVVPHDGGCERARFRPLLDIGLVQRVAVDQHLAVAHLDGLAGQGDDPLDEILDAVVGLVGRPLEHHHVAPVHVVQLVAELVDEDPVALLQRRHHRLRRDVEGGEEEGADDEGDDQRAADDGDPFDDRAGGGALRRRRRQRRGLLPFVAARNEDVLGRAHDCTVPAP